MADIFNGDPSFAVGLDPTSPDLGMIRESFDPFLGALTVRFHHSESEKDLEVF